MQRGGVSVSAGQTFKCASRRATAIVDFCLNVDRNIGAGARVGYGFSGKYILYGKLGYANLKMTATDGLTSESDSQGGVQGAIGFEGKMGKNAYWGGEVNYGDYGKFEGINLQRRHVAAKIGFRF